MKLRVGYELQYDFPQPTPVILMLSIHYTRVSDLERPDHIIMNPSVPISGYRDGLGNWCSGLLAPAGAMRISTDTVVSDTGLPDRIAPDATQTLVHELRRRPSFSFSRAATATATGFWTWHGPTLPTLSQAGRACRPYAIFVGPEQGRFAIDHAALGMHAPARGTAAETVPCAGSVLARYADSVRPVSAREPSQG